MELAVRIQRKTITGSRAGKHLLVLGGIHGDEYEPMAAVRRLIDTLDSVSLSGQVTLVPVVNEPAFESNSRTGPDGLDLARTFPGNPNGSLTERIAHEIAKLIHSADYLIDLHTGGLALEALPMAGYMLHHDDVVLNTQRRMACAMNLPIVWGTSPNLEGRSLSVARDANVPAIYAEWGGGGGCNPKGVEDYVQGCLHVMAELQMLDQHGEKNSVKHVVEDTRESSGHLQINYNAPAKGYFDSAVTLGSSVDVGDRLGSIRQPLGDTLATVVSKQRGMVLFLRALPRVVKGDCLAVIIELDAEQNEQRNRS